MKEILIAVIVLTSLGLILGLLIAVCSKYLSVEVDTRVETVQGMLPGVNCGGCGYPGCSGFAEALVSGKAKPESCKPCKEAKKAEIKQFLEENSK